MHPIARVEAAIVISATRVVDGHGAVAMLPPPLVRAVASAALMDTVNHDYAGRHHDTPNRRPANNHDLVSRTRTDVNIDVRPDLGGKRQGQERECADQRRPARDGERHGNLGGDMETE
jgi:hypothetical protein